MMTEAKLKKEVFEGREVVTKGYVKERLHFNRYDRVREIFSGVDPIPATHGRRFLTKDIISRMIWLESYKL